jgi:triacylglycerol lipase
MPKDDIVLLHGLGRNAQFMGNMAKQLTLSGYQVHNIDYPSTGYAIEELADRLNLQFPVASARPLHIVALSLGALLAHCYIKKYRPANLHRVVALGPPYHGSPIIDRLGKYRWFQRLYGPAALQLNTKQGGFAKRFGPADYELGVIAGDRSLWIDKYFANYWLKKPNDGKVEVASTRILGCRDHIVLHVNHVSFPNFPEVIEQTIYFLQHGYFKIIK